MMSRSFLRSPATLAVAAFALSVGCSGDPKPAASSPEGGSRAPASQSADQANADKHKGIASSVNAVKQEAAAKAGGEEKVKVVEGTRAGGDERYDLLIEPPKEAKAGQEGAVTVKVVPKKPWHMNLDFPTSLKMQAPDGVQLANAEQKKADAVALDDDSCEFAVKFTPSAAGEQSFTGKFKFAVCQAEACAPVTEELDFKVAVK